MPRPLLHTSVMTMPGAPDQTYGYPPPPPPRRDSTRTIAVVALVLAAVALVVPVAMTVVPLVLFAAVGGEPFGDPGDGAFLDSGHAEGLRVVVRGGAVDGPALAGVLRDEGPFAGERLTCQDAPRVVEDTATLCEVDADPRTYVVVRFTDGDGDFVADWFVPDSPFGPAF